MKSMLIKLGLLIVATSIFVWSHLHYAGVTKETSDAIVVAQYKVLDKQVWAMNEAQKEQALSQDGSYGDLQTLQRQNKSAATKSRIGFWLSILFGIGAGVYLLLVLYRLIVVMLIREKGYEKIVAMMEKTSGMKETDQND